MSLHLLTSANGTSRRTRWSRFTSGVSGNYGPARPGDLAARDTNGLIVIATASGKSEDVLRAPLGHPGRPARREIKATSCDIRLPKGGGGAAGYQTEGRRLEPTAPQRLCGLISSDQHDHREQRDSIIPFQKRTVPSAPNRPRSISSAFDPSVRHSRRSQL